MADDESTIPSMRERLAEIEEIKRDALDLGGATYVDRQKERGKLTCRERIDLLFDPGTFHEFGILAYHHPKPATKRTPADGVVTGYGKIAGRWVGCAAYDFTVMGGSIGETGERKVTELRATVSKWGMPIVWLIDSAGARIHAEGGMGGPLAKGGEIHEIREHALRTGLGASVFAYSGALFREQSIMSGVVPQVCAMMGPGAAGTAYIPGLADFVPMVKKTSSMGLGGPYLVKAAVGEDITEQDLGSKLHNTKSGVADLECKSDEACIDAIRTYLSFFPQTCREKPDVVPCDDPVDRADDELVDLVPVEGRKTYDVHEVIERIVDHGHFFPLKPKWAKNLVTGLTRIGGRACGIVANNPRHYGGVLDVDAADKGARFINLCDAFNVPLVFLMDTPGFLIGTKAESQGIIRHGAKMVHAVSCATVPKLTVILRKAYGAGYYAMCGKAYEPDHIVAWPTAEISVMGPEGLVSIFARKMLDAQDDPAPLAKMLADRIRPTIDPLIAAGWNYVDDIIDPRDTRKVLATLLELTRDKTVERPWRKHGVVPV